MLAILTFLFPFSISAHNQKCELRNQDKDRRTVIRDLLMSQETPTCDPIKIGSHRTYRIPRSKSPTGVKMSYSLERPSEKEYRIQFNFEMFQTHDDDAESLRNKAYTYYWKNTANECLSQLQGKILGPNREILNMQVEIDTKKNRAPVESIELMEDGRAHSHGWTKKIDCPTIVHELLHLTGLVDEYKEQMAGFKLDPQLQKMVWVAQGAEKPAYDCRKIYNDTIMSNQGAAWNNALGTWSMKSSLCECQSQERCDEYQRQRKQIFQKYFHDNFEPKVDRALIPRELTEVQTVCPEGYSIAYTQTRNISSEEKQAIEAGQGYGVAVEPNMSPERIMKMVPIYSFEKRSETDQYSLLEERHWNAIIYPGCLGKNHKYYEDSKNAYRTSFENGGQGCLQSDK